MSLSVAMNIDFGIPGTLISARKKLSAVTPPPVDICLSIAAMLTNQSLPSEVLTCFDDWRRNI